MVIWCYSMGVAGNTIAKHGGAIMKDWMTSEEWWEKARGVWCRFVAYDESKKGTNNRGSWCATSFKDVHEAADALREFDLVGMVMVLDRERGSSVAFFGREV